MRVSEIIHEQVTRLDGRDGQAFLVLINPGVGQLLANVKRWGGARGLFNGGRYYWWNDNDAIHHDVEKQVGDPADWGHNHLWLTFEGRTTLTLAAPEGDLPVLREQPFFKQLIASGVRLYRA